jgi:hypothetical protein
LILAAAVDAVVGLALSAAVPAVVVMRIEFVSDILDDCIE